mgnify:CR=1 FL=1
MFKHSASGSFIPSKQVIVKPESQVDYNPRTQNQLRFLIPQYLGFFDPKDTQLTYKLKMSGRGRPQPSGRAGVHSLWRDFRIQDGTAQTVLEEVQDYNVLTSQWWGYTQNDSIAAKRNLFEGRQVSRSIDRSIYYQPANARWAQGKVEVAQPPQTLQIQQPLYSGIMSGDKVFPVVATQGLRVALTLDSIERSVEFQTGSLGCDEPECLSLKVPILGQTGATPADQQIKVNETDTFSCIVKRPADGEGGRGVFRNATPENNNPFDIGDRLMIALPNSTPAVPAGVRSLGIITSFETDGDGDLKIDYIPDRAAGAGLVSDYLTTVGACSKVFIRTLDRVNGVVVTNVPAAQVAAAAVQVNYTLSDVEWLVSVVSPPQGYVSALMGQVTSSKGLAMDFKTYSTQRVNLAALNGLTTQLIPATARRAYSILSVPLFQGIQNDMSKDSFGGAIDGSQNYQYVLGGHLVPDRPISLSRYTLADPKIDALHLIELEKSLVNCGYGVRNLQRVPVRFLIGRAFSKYGQVSDLSQRDLSLRIDYRAATQAKLFNHYVCHLRRMVVSSSGVQAF